MMAPRACRPRGQSTVEYALLMLAAAATFVFMYGYVRSTVQGHMKDGADGVGHGMAYRGWSGRPPGP